MNRISAVQLVLSGVVTLVVAGITYGMAVGWSPTEGTHVMAIAATVVFAAMAVGILVSGSLRDIGDRPDHAPTAFRAGFGTSLFLMLVASVPLVLTGVAPLAPYLVWLLAHAGAQTALALLVFRRQDPDEVRRGGHAPTA